MVGLREIEVIRGQQKQQSYTELSASTSVISMVGRSTCFSSIFGRNCFLESVTVSPDFETIPQN